MIRLARPDDVAGIKKLIDDNQDKLIPRPADEIRELLPTFWVAEEDGEIVGCCCLEVYSAKIAEVRSLAVREGCRGKGYGAELVRLAIEEATRRHIRQVLAVTSTLEFFEQMNFKPFLGEKYALFWNPPKPPEDSKK
jgi:amino-acid N-acetyltransferase